MIDLSDTAAVYARAREAYANGELQAQQPKDARLPYCSYTGPCAIGVSVPVEQRRELDYDSHQVESGRLMYPGNGITLLIQRENRVLGDLEALRQLQQAHDIWTTNSAGTSADEKRAEEEFVRVMNLY